MVAPASYLCSLASFARSSSSLRSRPAKSGTRRSDSVASVLTAIDSSCVLSATLRYRTQPKRAAPPPSLPRERGRVNQRELDKRLAAADGGEELHLQLFHARAEFIELLFREKFLDL